MTQTWTPTDEADIKKYGCETCRYFYEGPLMIDPEVSRRAAEAVFRDRPGYFMKENKMNTLETVSGKFLDPSNINLDMIDIHDIAWSLSRISRFAGHTITAVPYNVAQHCVFVANMILKDTDDYLGALAGLLHDAAECYIGDIPSPIKKIPALKAVIGPIEDNILEAVYRKFMRGYDDWDKNLHNDVHDLVHTYDKRAQFIEAHAFMSSRGLQWPGRENHDISLIDLQEFPVPITSVQAYEEFINTFNRLRGPLD